MTIRVAITGFGRIGRDTLRAHYEGGKKRDLEIVAINASGNHEVHEHLLKYDTVHGRFNADVRLEGNDLLRINGDPIKLFATRDPGELPWGDLGVDVVLECTGAFRSKEKVMPHIDGGAGKVLISAPATEVDATVVYGVNDEILRSDMRVVSAASCTTNCLAPMAKALHDAVGIERGLMTTIHAFTNDQKILDVYHKDLRRARAAGYAMIPTKTGAAKAVGLVLPELNGRLDGYAIRVPVINVSLVDLSFIASRPTSVEEINEIMREAAAGDRFKGVLGFNQAPLVSSDFNHDERSSVFDATLTKVSGGVLVKASSWYDNEWGFSCRMLDNAVAMMTAR